MEYMVYTSKKVETHDLVGYKLQWGKLIGTIIDVIPAGEKPTEEAIIKFYGENYPRGAYRAIRYDRALIETEVHNLQIVVPLNCNFKIFCP